MAFSEGSNDGTLNGTTAVEIVAAPASGARRMVKTITVYNRDTVSHFITLQYVHDTNTRKIGRFWLQPDEALVFDNVLVLDATDKSIKAVMASAATTTAPDFTAHYGEVS